MALFLAAHMAAHAISLSSDAATGFECTIDAEINGLRVLFSSNMADPVETRTAAAIRFAWTVCVPQQAETMSFDGFLTMARKIYLVRQLRTRGAVVDPIDCLQTVKKAEVAGNVTHDAWQQGERAAGNGSVHNAHLKHREIEYVDGQKGSRKARGSPKESAGAAGKKIGKESSLMQSKKNPQASVSPGKSPSRPFGKASGLRLHSESEGVASVLGSPSKRASSAYELALAEGRALLASPYTHNAAAEDGFAGSLDGGVAGPYIHQPTASDTKAVGGPKPTKSRTGYTPPKYGVGDAAGNFRKERMIVHKPRPETALGAPPPFGVDPVSNDATRNRFATSASSIGGAKKERIIDYTTLPPGAGEPGPASTALVAAGQRPFFADKARGGQ